MTEAMKQSLKAINKFFYFSQNYDYNFIEIVWQDEPWLVEHLRGKFNALYKSTGSVGVMNAFYAELDGNNRVKLMAWVMENYSGCDGLTGLNKSYFIEN